MEKEIQQNRRQDVRSLTTKFSSNPHTYTTTLPPATIPPSSFFFFNDAATTAIYTLSLHDALPISEHRRRALPYWLDHYNRGRPHSSLGDRKSTRLNSSHEWISYAVFCLKKKK